MKNRIEIIDNYLSKKDFKRLREIFIDTEVVNWTRCAVNDLDKNFYFTHIAFQGIGGSHFIHEMNPLLNKIKTKALIRIKVNCYPCTEKIIHHEKHTDFSFSHKGAIFSLNDCDGGTYINEQFIESKANRILFFDPSIPHNSTSTTKKEGRININFNYF